MINFLIHFLLGVTIAFLFTTRDAIIVSLTIEATQLEVCWSAKTEPDIEDTIKDLMADGIGITFGAWLKKQIWTKNTKPLKTFSK